MISILALLQTATVQSAEAAKQIAVATVQPTEVGANAMNAIWIFFLQRYVKRLLAYDWFVKHFPVADKWAHWAFAAIASAIAVIGIHVTGTWTAEEGGSYQVQLPAIATVAHNLADWIRQFGMQQFAYLVAKDKTA